MGAGLRPEFKSAVPSPTLKPPRWGSTLLAWMVLAEVLWETPEEQGREGTP